MQEHSKGQTEYELTENHLLRISNAKGRRVECVTGSALITAYGEPTDFSIRQGNTFTIPNDGLTLIETIGKGRVRIKAAPPPGRAWLERVGRKAGNKLGSTLRRLRRSLQGGQPSTS
ncbi:hypothetical protein AAKU55_001742 [Oxalobacteraceae bacterium GrIS 1.11]